LIARPKTAKRHIAPRELPWLIAVCVAAVYLVVFVTKIPSYLGEIGWVSDFASEFVLPESIVVGGTGGHTLLSTTGAWLPLWFGLFTAELPLHRELWEIAPTLLLFASALMIGWSVAQVATRRAALLATLMVVVASPWALAFFMAPAHTIVYPATALVGVYLIWLTRGRLRGRSSALGVPLLGALLVGACVASDALFIVTGLIPLAFTGIVIGLQGDRSSRRVALSALTTAVGAIPVAKAVALVMGKYGFVTLPPAVKLAPLSMLGEHAQLLWGGLKHLFNGYLGHASVGNFTPLTPVASGPLHLELGLACDVVLVAALIALAGYGGRAAIQFCLRRWRGGDPASPAQLAHAVHVIYWLSSAVAICGAFVIGTRAAARYEAYYATVVFSVAAVVPLLMRRGSVTYWLVPVGALVLFAGSLVGLTSNYIDTVYDPPISHYGATVTDIAREHGVTYGYAGYWDAASLTWSSHQQVTVRPLAECPTPAGTGVCPFFLNRVPSWYVPQQRHTFLLVDPASQYVVKLPAGLGPPLESFSIGPMQMYIYPYDIASRLGPAPD
jgi:hypothetical protein